MAWCTRASKFQCWFHATVVQWTKEMQSNGWKNKLNMRAILCWATSSESRLNLYTIITEWQKKILNGVSHTTTWLIDQVTMASLEWMLQKTTVGLFSYTCLFMSCLCINIKKRRSNRPGIFFFNLLASFKATAKFNPDAHFFWSKQTWWWSSYL